MARGTIQTVTTRRRQRRQRRLPVASAGLHYLSNVSSFGDAVAHFPAHIQSPAGIHDHFRCQRNWRAVNFWRNLVNTILRSQPNVCLTCNGNRVVVASWLSKVSAIQVHHEPTCPLCHCHCVQVPCSGFRVPSSAFEFPVPFQISLANSFRNGSGSWLTNKVTVAMFPY